MSIPNNQFYDDLLDDLEDVVDMEFSDLQNGTLDDFLAPFQTNEDFSKMLSSSSIPSNSYTQAPSNSLSNDNSRFQRLQMVEQPFQSSKLRYRTDYMREKGRVGALGNKNLKSKLKGPAISIPNCYLNSTNEYYIRVSLVTVKYDKTNLYYFHPYELEHAKNQSVNDRQTNSVWFPIGSKDSIKNFPLLRIVKKKAFQTQKLDYLHVFDYHTEILQNPSLAQHSLKNEIDIIKEFTLEKSQLAFTVGEKFLINGQPTIRLHFNTTVFSEPMNENDDRQSDTDTDTESSGDKTTSPSSSLNQYVYKYAPQSGHNKNNGEMLIFLKKRLEVRKHGDLKVLFQYDAYNGHWSETIVDLDIKDRMISFKIPNYPYSIKEPITVDIILRQDHRILATLKYSYLPTKQ